MTYLNVLIRYVLRFGLVFLTAWITTCTWDTTLSMTMESQLNGLEWHYLKGICFKSSTCLA
ncbi:TMhelix containing protein [Vibrio phage 382E49-1]|nr:TMhelix containing protein [Vibrio phage 141E35-1]CAH9015868.1 TMhelix containing protein [Vibrio phage 382E49-1]